MSGQSSSGTPSEPLFERSIDGVLFVAAVLVITGVIFYIDMGVNRVFDIPKALFLKTLGGLATALWLALATFGPGVRWTSAKLYAAPVIGLLVCVSLSTLFSIDRPTSWYGVYERQFGLQGFMSCVGLYFIVSTTLASRRAAVLGLVTLVLLSGMMGAYTFLQSQGHDPWPFFREPHNKVYAFLGNATFAGNAIALIFPLGVALAVISLIETQKRSAQTAADLTAWAVAVLAGFMLVAGLLILPGYIAAADLTPKMAGLPAQRIFRVGYALVIIIMGSALAMGSYGLPGIQLDKIWSRRFSDAVAAGGIFACACLIGVGLICTRTRGAWVATAVASLAALFMVPLLFNDKPKLRAKVAFISYMSMAVFALGVVAFALVSDTVAAKTIRSIPASFDTSKNLGKGQGTRPYLWWESPRVLTEHNDTLSRIYEDQRERSEKLQGRALRDLPFKPTQPWREADIYFDRAWRSVSVWLFGIGIETYRYAFMSHKSKRLEELDPMTNHDNPHNNYLYVLASFGVLGLLAYLWLLWSLLRRSFLQMFNLDRPRWERGVTLGLVSSFFSYTVYSIAGFDSVACSVFFYFLLGASAVFFSPGGRPCQLRDELKKISVFKRGQASWVGYGISGVYLVLLAFSSYGGWSIYQADRAFTGRISGWTGPTNRLEYRVESIEQAIKWAPHESYYKQSLATTYSQAASQYKMAARRRTDKSDIQKLTRTAQYYQRKAELSLLAALEHAWAPENIYITLFQVLYQPGSAKGNRAAEHALERALRHSPHLGAVRANLAALKAARGAFDEAYVDCRWVLEVNKKSGMAYRVCGEVLLNQGKYAEAKTMLEQARRYSPKDAIVKRLLMRLDKVSSSTIPVSNKSNR